jgi:hypothetical protein
MNFVNMLPEDSFSRRNLALENRAVFPTSTGPNLFAFCRAQWPGQHGKLGWYVYLPELGERATLFPWERTSDDVSLSDLGLDGETVFPGDPLVPTFGRDCAVFNPDFISASIPTLAMHGEGAVTGYPDLSDAVDLVSQRVLSARASTYTHLYWNKIDSVAHGNGVSHPETLTQVRLFDSEMKRLRNLFPDSARLLVTADHGHADSPKERRFRIDPEDEISQMLESAPAGESRILFFRVRKGMRQEFAKKFRERYEEHMFLFSTEEVLELGLLGPEGVSEFVANRIGDFLAVTKGAYSIELCAAGDERMLRLESTHGGFLPDETLVPLIIA